MEDYLQIKRKVKEIVFYVFYTKSTKKKQKHRKKEYKLNEEL